MKNFIKWWLKGTGFGGNIKLYVSLILLLFVLVSGGGKSQPRTNTYNNSNNSETYCVEEYDRHLDIWEEVCY